MTTSSLDELDRLRQEGKISEDEHRQIKDALDQRRQVLGLRGVVPVRRVETAREIAGVCAGLAERFGVRPWNMRIAFLLLLIIANGLALLAYVVLALLMAPGDARDTRPRRFPAAFFFALTGITLAWFIVARLTLPLLATQGTEMPSFLMRALVRHAALIRGIILPLAFTILSSLFLYWLPEKGVVRRALASGLPAVSAAALIAAVIAIAIPL